MSHEATVCRVDSHVVDKTLWVCVNVNEALIEDASPRANATTRTRRREERREREEDAEEKKEEEEEIEPSHLMCSSLSRLPRWLISALELLSNTWHIVLY